jgi:hypothetical protein
MQKKEHLSISKNTDSNSSSEDEGWKILYELNQNKRIINTVSSSSINVMKSDLEKTPGNEDNKIDEDFSRILKISEWQITFNWLDYKKDEKNGEILLVCKSCVDFHKTKKTGFTQGSNNFQLSSIKDHNSSKYHIDSENSKVNQTKFIAIETDKKSIEFIPEKMLIIFSNIYFLALNKIPLKIAPKFHDYSDFCHLNISKDYRSSYSTSEILEAINKTIENMKVKIIDKCGAIGLMIDESTDIDKDKVLMVYLRYLEPSTHLPVETFYKLIQLNELNGQAIFDSLFPHLLQNGLINKIFSINTDGARVMTSLERGVAGLLLQKIPNLIVSHCAAHRLNLVTSTVMEDFKDLDEVITFLYDIDQFFRRTYNYSRLLKEKQEELLEKKLRLIRPLKVRWLSYYGAIQRFIKLLPIILETLQDIESSEDRAKGYLKKLKNYNFIGKIFFLNDILSILSYSCKILQEGNLNYSRLINTINEDLNIIEQRYLTEIPSLGQSQLDFINNTKSKDFLNFKLQHVDKVVTISFKRNPNDEINLINSSIIMARKIHSSLIQRFQSNDILDALDIVNFSRIRHEYKNMKPKDFGDKHIKYIKEYFSERCTFTDKLIYQWEKFKFNFWPLHYVYEDSFIFSKLFSEKLETYDEMILLIQIYYSITLTTVEVERGFSKMNSIKTRHRNSLSASTVDALLNIRLNGVEIQNFDFQQAYENWLSRRPRKIISKFN